MLVLHTDSEPMQTGNLNQKEARHILFFQKNYSKKKILDLQTLFQQNKIKSTYLFVGYTNEYREVISILKNVFQSQVSMSQRRAQMNVNLAVTGTCLLPASAKRFNVPYQLLVYCLQTCFAFMTLNARHFLACLNFFD